MINDLWYKNAVIYCLSVGTYMDADGDGIGDFRGLMRRLDYLQGLGVTAIWLMPFQPSPGRDDGYDISDYYGVNPAYGSLGDFVEFTHAAKQRSIRVIIDLVVNHTSDQHPWFQDAIRDPRSPYRNWCIVWSKSKPANSSKGMVFPWRPEIHMVVCTRGEGLVFSSLLQIPARPQHFESRGAGGDPQDHGILDPARGLRISHGCGTFRDRHQRAQNRRTRRAVRNAEDIAGVSAMAAGGFDYPRGSVTCCPRPTWSISRSRWRSRADDVQFPGQSNAVLRLGRSR